MQENNSRGRIGILITTSRNPTQTMRTFCNELSHIIPCSERVNRGKSSLIALAEKSLERDIKKLLIADRWAGRLGKVQLYEINDKGLVQYYPVICVKNVKLRRNFGQKARGTAKRLALRTSSQISFEANKLADALASFLCIPRLPPEGLNYSETQTIMHISVNATRHIHIKFLQTPQEIEIGPHITTSHLVWKPQK